MGPRWSQHHHHQLLLISLLLLLLPLITAQRVSECKKLEEEVHLNVTTSTDYLQTPAFGEDYYPLNMSCKFVLTAPEGYRILIDVIEVEMESQLFDECLDFIQISKGDCRHLIGDLTGNSHLIADTIATICGEARNQQISSTDNSVVVTMQTDGLIQAKGANLSYKAIPLGKCDPGWVETPKHNCLKLYEPKVGTDFVDAQLRCAQLQSNLATIPTEADYNFTMTYLSKKSTHAWIGYTDSEFEGSVRAITSNTKGIWPSPQPPLNDNDDLRDCIYLDLVTTHWTKGELPYRIGDCRMHQSYICEKKNDGSTAPVTSPADMVRRGSKIAGFDRTLLLLLLMMLLLLLIVICICFHTWSKKHQNRIHTTDNRLVHGIEQTSGLPPATTIEVRGTSPAVVQNPAPQVRPLPVPPAASTHNGTKRSENVRNIQHEANVHHGPEASPDVPHIETNANNETAVFTPKTPSPQPETSMTLNPPEPKPRTVPGLPIREETLQTLYTREGSFLRTKRNQDVVFDRPKMDMLDNISAISLDEFWTNKKKS